MLLIPEFSCLHSYLISNSVLRAVAASVVRMKYFLDVISIGFDPFDDEDLAITRNLYWCMVESGLSLLAVCLPTMRSLFTARPPGWATSVWSVFTSRSRSWQPSGEGAGDSYTQIRNGELAPSKSNQEVYVMDGWVPGVSEANLGQAAYCESRGQV